MRIMLPLMDIIYKFIVSHSYLQKEFNGMQQHVYGNMNQFSESKHEINLIKRNLCI